MPPEHQNNKDHDCSMYIESNMSPAHCRVCGKTELLTANPISSKLEGWEDNLDTLLTEWSMGKNLNVLEPDYQTLRLQLESFISQELQRVRTEEREEYARYILGKAQMTFAYDKAHLLTFYNDIVDNAQAQINLIAPQKTQSNN